MKCRTVMKCRTFFNIRFFGDKQPSTANLAKSNYRLSSIANLQTPFHSFPSIPTAKSVSKRSIQGSINTIQYLLQTSSFALQYLSKESQLLVRWKSSPVVRTIANDSSALDPSSCSMSQTKQLTADEVCLIRLQRLMSCVAKTTTNIKVLCCKSFRLNFAKCRVRIMAEI